MARASEMIKPKKLIPDTREYFVLSSMCIWERILSRKRLVITFTMAKEMKKIIMPMIICKGDI
jgi:hypothetical protein